MKYAEMRVTTLYMPVAATCTAGTCTTVHAVQVSDALAASRPTYVWISPLHAYARYLAISATAGLIRLL